MGAHGNLYLLLDTGSNEPAQEILVLIALARSEGSDKSAHKHSLTKALASPHIQSIDVKEGSDRKLDFKFRCIRSMPWLMQDVGEDN